jgi:hypothetical protein
MLPPTPPKAAAPTLPTPPPEPKIDPLEAARNAARREVREQVNQQLLMEADMFLLGYQDQGYNRFKCDIAYGRPGFPMTMYLANEKGEKVSGSFKIDYAKAYKNRGLEFGPADAIDHKMILQSYVFNKENIDPIRLKTKGGRIGVGLDDIIPIKSYAAEPKIVPSDGAFSLQIVAKDRNSSDWITLSIPLGVADKPGDDNARFEAEIRKEIVMGYIKDRAKNQQYPDKRQVLDHLRNNVDTWVQRDRIYLTGFEEQMVIHQVGGERPQKITLGPVSIEMPPGGINPTWKLDYSLYANDDPNDKSEGTYIRHRTMPLHTSDFRLAMARAQQSLLGAKTDKESADGFLDMVGKYCAAHPNDRWQVMEDSNGGREAMIGTKRLQDFLDDMQRYEDDITFRVVDKIPTVNSNVSFKIQALRGTRPDVNRTAAARPEVIQNRRDNQEKPFDVEIELVVPERVAGRIPEFLEKVKRDIAWVIENEYASFRIGARKGEADGRKKPKEYNPNFVPTVLEKTIEKLVPEVFGIPFEQALNGSNRDHLRTKRPKRNDPKERGDGRQPGV